MRNWAHYFLGLVHLERNELADAELHFLELVEHRHTTFMAVLHDGIAGLALVYQAEGQSDKAEQTLGLLSELDLERIGHEDARTRSLRARLRLLQRDVDGAGRWADAFAETIPDQPLLWMEVPLLTRARILIARHLDADVSTAFVILDALHGLAERTHNTRVRLDILALRALALDAGGRSEEALAALREAVELARQGGFIRLFLDLGPRMQTMLGSLARQGVAVDSTRRILAAFSDSRSDGPEAARERLSSPGSSSLVEPLSARELDVLELLELRLSDKEIASKLFISPTTVKRHTANIYGKLGVHRRSDAVARAEALGILPSR